MIRPSSISECRRGGIALAALIALPVALLAFIAGLWSCQFTDIRAQMQKEADAAALAGADALLGDALLRGRLESGTNSTELYALLQNSRLVIQSYAQLNPVYGGYSVPDWDLANPTQGDIIFGAYDRTQSTPFTPILLVDSMNNPTTDLELINSVQVFMRRTQATGNPIPLPHMPLIGTGQVDFVTVSTAMLDGDLQGFRPLFADRPIPLVPCALDYATVTTQTTTSFTDKLAFDPTTQAFVASQDQLPEITVNLTTATPPANVVATAFELNIGFTNASDVAGQIAGGVQPAQLTGQPFNGAFLLTPDASMPSFLTLTVPGQQYFASTDGNTLVNSGFSLIAQTPFTALLWPISNGFDVNGNPIVVGFIAARLASVQTTSDGNGNVQAITLTLQPSLVSAPSAVTNSAYRGYVGVPNQTIAKLRLVPN